jgi:hypothetical protein
MSDPAVLHRPAWLTTLAFGFALFWLIVAAFPFAWTV